MDIPSWPGGGQIQQEYTQSQIKVSALSRQVAEKSGDSDRLREACEDFEAIFIKMMLDSMRSTLSEDTLIPKNAGEKLFEDKLYEQYAKDMSRTASLGLADMMYDQLAGGDSLPGEGLDIGG